MFVAALQIMPPQKTRTSMTHPWSLHEKLKFCCPTDYSSILILILVFNSRRTIFCTLQYHNKCQSRMDRLVIVHFVFTIFHTTHSYLILSEIKLKKKTQQKPSPLPFVFSVRFKFDPRKIFAQAGEQKEAHFFLYLCASLRTGSVIEYKIPTRPQSHFSKRSKFSLALIIRTTSYILILKSRRWITTHKMDVSRKSSETIVFSSPIYHGNIAPQLFILPL